jgi:hypothetical protein
MKQEQRRTGTAHAAMDSSPTDLYVLRFEILEYHVRRAEDQVLDAS